MQTLSIGFSPCPNDTFIFYPLIHGKIADSTFRFAERLEDVETLNLLAREGTLDVCKVSYHAFAYLREQYVLLRSGGAMGKGCGPLVVSKNLAGSEDIRGKTIAVPGRLTTACLLLRLFDQTLTNLVVLPFNEIMPAVENGIVDAGVIIHESRFTYPSHGLRKVLDLGAWWENETGLPLPLGGIAARRSLGSSCLTALSRLVRSSVEYALANPAESLDYVRRHAQEMSEEVCSSHIALYVNGYSLDPGSDGARAAETLFSRGAGCGVLPLSNKSLFVPAER